MINVQFIDMPTTVKATHTLNEDDSYTVLINSRQSDNIQRDAYIHEIKHILNEDFYKDVCTSELELNRHKEAI